MDKTRIVQKIIEKLEAELNRYFNAAKAAQDGAASEQSRAENKYDTRGLEAAYLAHGQSRQIAETQESIKQYSGLLVEGSRPAAAVELGALVALAWQGDLLHYFIGSGGGGTEIVSEGIEVVVITLHSPLGRSLSGRKRGEIVRIGDARYEIASVT